MIVVTGATGQLGRLIVLELLERVDADGIGVSVRDPGKADALRAKGVRVRRGDFDDPAGLAHAFEGAEQVLIVSSNAAARGGDPVAQHRNAIGAARAAGARRIVYTSHMGADARSAFPPMRDHAATEAMLAEEGLADGGIAWTALRNGFYAESGADLLGDASDTGLVRAPADGPVSWTTHADLARAAAAVLTGGERTDGPTPPLTGTEALDLSDLAAMLSEELGRPVRRETIADDELRAGMAAKGAPAAAARMLLGLYAASRAGEFAAVDPTLERLIGRAPGTMRAVLAARVAR